jgi:hypothetical protein
MKRFILALLLFGAASFCVASTAEARYWGPRVYYGWGAPVVRYAPRYYVARPYVYYGPRVYAAPVVPYGPYYYGPYYRRGWYW